MKNSPYLSLNNLTTNLTNMRKSNLLIFAFLGIFNLIYHHSFAQIEASSAAIPPFDPIGLIENEFLGEGIEVLNITFEGEHESVGYFTNGSSSIGIESGILLTTGVVESAGADVGVNEFGNVQANADNGSTISDMDLEGLSSTSLFNIARYTIQFIPSSDSLSFRYVFASEEYPEFVCSDYNDIFGFFISGPGISGPFQNGAINMALVPGTSSPVTINNVNGGVIGSQGTLSNCSAPDGSLDFAQFYVDNDGAASFPVFDGWHTPFEAKVAVTPCEVYTIVIVIADQGDPQRDSGVFLEAKSFGSQNIKVDLVTQSIDGTILEGCTEAAVMFDLGSPRNTDTDIDLSLLGDAINGVDFETINTSITIPAGQTTLTLPIHAIEDGITEGTEELKIAVQVNACLTDTFNLYLNDFSLPPLVVEDEMICPGGSVELDGSVAVAIPDPVTIGSSNNNIVITSPLPGQIPGSVISSLEVYGVQPLQLGPDIIQSVCINIDHNRVEDLDIYLRAPGGQLIPLSTDNGGLADNYTNTCFTPTATDNITNGVAPFTGVYQPEGNWSDLWFGDSPLNGTWELEIIDDASGFNGILVDWEITFNPVFEINYEWSPTTGLSCTDCPVTTATPSATTTYEIVATDAFGCTVSDEATVTILPPDFADAGPDQNICSQGTATLTASGGVDYLWSTGETTASISVDVITTTTYSVTVTNDGGCTDTDEVEVIVGNSLGLDLVKTDISCAGANDGSITVTPSGGQSPFEYGWSNAATTATISNLSAQAYSVTVTDANNCSNSSTIEILDQLPLEIEMEVTNTCEGATGGEASVDGLSGGVAPYSFQWDTNTGNQINSVATNLPGGAYTVVVTDANNCSVIETAMVESIDTVQVPVPSCGTVTNGTITFVWSDDFNAESFEVKVDNGGWISPSGLLSHTVNGLALGQTVSIQVRANGTCNAPIGTTSCTTLNCTPIDFEVQNLSNVSCFNANDGIVNLIATGDNGPFTYHLNGQSNNSGIFSDLLPSDHTATVEDAIGCINAVSFIIEEPSELEVNGQVINQPGCSTLGSVSAMVTGGSYPYSYTWNVPPTDSVLTELAGGTYDVVVTDFNGCTSTASIDLIDYELMSAILNVQNVDCSGDSLGTIEALVQGGVMPIQYLWDDPMAQTTPLASGLSAGSYTLIITDGNGCTLTQSASVETPDKILLDSIVVSSITCFGADNGSATVYASGGTGNLEYNWSNSSMTSSIFNLSADSYFVTITDENDCELESSIDIIEPEELVITAEAIPLTCFNSNNGMIDVDVSGGSPAYTYEWSNNSKTEDIDSLEAGDYALTITDENGCSVAFAAEVSAPAEMVLSIQTSSPTCAGIENGSVMVTVNGGIPGYDYIWSNNITGTNQLNDLSPGFYEVTVSDNNNCTQTITTTIVPGPEISMEYILDYPICAGDDGALNIIPLGGEPPYSTIINGFEYPGQLAFDNVPPGNFSIELIDANGCSALIEDVVMEEAYPIEVDLGVDLEISIGDSILLVPQVNFGAGALIYEWSVNNSDTYISCPNCPTIQALPEYSSNISLIVTDENGCIGEDEIDVIVDRTKGVYIPNAFSPNGDGVNDYFTVYSREGGKIEELMVFSRWGEKVFTKTNFETNTDRLGWDGTFKGQPLDAGVFVYWARISFTHGEEEFHEGNIKIIK